MEDSVRLDSRRPSGSTSHTKLVTGHSAAWYLQ